MFVIKCEVLARIRVNMHKGIKMHFPRLARAGSRIFKTTHIFQILDGRYMACQFVDIYGPTPNLLVFGVQHHVVDVTADVNHMLYFVLTT